MIVTTWSIGGRERGEPKLASGRGGKPDETGEKGDTIRFDGFIRVDYLFIMKDSNFTCKNAQSNISVDADSVYLTCFIKFHPFSLV